jgi:hypothetical protein
MHKELQNSNWVFAVRRISTEVEIREFINLCQLLRGVSLNMNKKDEILWRWTTNEDYSASSSYKIQFQGSHPPFQTKKLWKARAEPKVKIFWWTSMHQKNLTADNLDARGMPHNPLCPLCGMEPEDAKHLLINCVFTREIYRLIWLWFGMRGQCLHCAPSVAWSRRMPSTY